MAGGKITRIIGGSNNIECESWTVYTDEFSVYAGQESHFTADEGTNFGDPKEAPTSYQYFEKGWWTNENGQEIKEAQIGDKIKFHLKMKNIKSPKGKKVNLELREWDDFDLLMYIVSFMNKELVGHKNTKEYETINLVSNTSNGNVVLTDWELDENSEIVVNLLLDEDSLSKMISNDEGRDLELFFRCRYIDENNLPEIAELPWETWNYLKVKPKPIVEPIIFVHASNEHLLPAIYSTEDGSPWYINTFKTALKNGLHSNKINTLSKPYTGNIKKGITSFEKQAYKIAIRKLEKGELIFNTGRKGTTSRYYELDISQIDKKFKDKIKVGVNRGTGIPGETSKGINQLEAQSQRGLAGTIKTVGEIAGIFGVLSDMTALLRGVADHEIPTPSIIPPFVKMEVDKMTEDIKDFNITHWNAQLQEAILRGQTELKDFLNNFGGINKQYNLGYSLVDISQEVLNKILTKDISEYDKSSTNFESYIIDKSQGKKDASILVQNIEENDKYNRLTINHYIHALYIKDLKI